MRVTPFLLCLPFALAIAAPPAKADQSPEYVGPPVIIPGPPSPPISVRPGALAGPMEDTRLHLPDAEATCDGAPLAATYSDPLPAVQRRVGASYEDTVLAFSVAADGRTLDIRSVEGATAASDRLQASLAAWRFPPHARKDCRLIVRWRTVSVEQADTSDLLTYFAVTRDRGALRDAVAKRLGGPNSDCDDRFGGRRPAVMAYPDFEKGRRPPPGGRSWTVVRWNIDAEGRNTDIATLGSSGDVDLDAEARRTMADSRMRPGPARTGCVYNFYRTGETLEAPPMPPEDQRPDPLQQCPASVAERFKPQSNLVFPTAFRDRPIEGWALIRFDVAPWGQIGNAAVVEAQPATAFGTQALQLVQSSRASGGFEAGVRCVVPVRYKMPAENAAPEADQN